MHYVFSYGSNHKEQLAQRVLRERGFTANEVSPGCLENYTRIFAGYSTNWKGAVASVHPAPGQQVFGSIIELKRHEIKLLDDHEGVGCLHPYGYERRILPVVDQSCNSGTVRDCYVYIKRNTAYDGPPSLSYLQAIRRMLDETDRPHTPRITVRCVAADGCITVCGWWKPGLDEMVADSEEE